MHCLTMLLLLIATLFIEDARAQTQPSDPRIGLLENALRQEPASLVRRCDLTRALLERYRHTAEPALLTRAAELLTALREQAPDNFEAQKLKAWETLLRGRTAQALPLILALHKKMPDDLELYGYLVEAHTKLGQLDQAEHQANWMLRLRPQHPDTLRRAAELRERFGDAEGALLMWNDLYRRTPPIQSLDRAYILARVARLIKASNPERAKAVAAESLRIAPDSQEARNAVQEVSE